MTMTAPASADGKDNTFNLGGKYNAQLGEINFAKEGTFVTGLHSGWFPIVLTANAVALAASAAVATTALMF